MNVLFHIDQLAHWHMTVTNVKNMMEFGKDQNIQFTIEIVANGEAVKYLTVDNPGQEQLAEQFKIICGNGVQIAACNNALKANDIKPSSLLPFITIVPAGVVEIAMKQEAGYSYIKP